MEQFKFSLDFLLIFHKREQDGVSNRIIFIFFNKFCIKKEKIIELNKMNPCHICKTETKNSCSNCKQVFYCSPQHQKEHWKEHKKDCHPFKVSGCEILLDGTI